MGDMSSHHGKRSQIPSETYHIMSFAPIVRQLGMTPGDIMIGDLEKKFKAEHIL